MGKPGSGKGTQAQLLKEKLTRDGLNVMHVTTGGSFRQFIKGESYVASRAREVQNSGLLQPEFLSVWNWTQIFIDTLKEDTTVILDGAPRKITEVDSLHELFPFLQYSYPPVIYVDVSDAWAKDRMKYRESTSIEKREDVSSDEEIQKRIDEFTKYIIPCVEMFKNDSRYSFLHVNGEQTVEEVHAEIVSKLSSLPATTHYLP
ncbi:MAG: hypothetical protein RIQ41_299 [Candidatus Parcubacteria bacterium]